VKRRFRLSLGARGARRDIDSEIAFHLEMRAAEFEASGLTGEEAMAAARQAFGNPRDVTTACQRIRRNRGRLEAIRAVAQDARLALRSLARSPGFAVAVVVSLALGIGANTAIFSLINGVLLQPLPYRHGGDLVQLIQPAPKADVADAGFSPPEVADYAAETATLSGISEYHSMPFILLGLERPQRVQTGVVSASFFDVLGLRPILGRTFLPGEDSVGATPVLVLSHHTWRSLFGGDPGVIGRHVEMNDKVHVIVGVLPPIPHHPNLNDVYMPVSACPFRSRPGRDVERNVRGLIVFARKRPGVTLDGLQRDLEHVAQQMHTAHPNAYLARYGLETRAVPLREELIHNARPSLFVLLGTAGFLLLIVTANVANLTLARMVRREREMAIRASLGAGRLRLFRQLLTESLILALVGGAVGLFLAYGGLSVLVAFLERLTPRAAEVHIDGTVLAFAAAVSLLTAVVLSLVPALPSRVSLMQELREGGGSLTAGSGRLRARSALIVAQVAVSFVLLIGAGLMLRTFVNLLRVDPGFETEQILTARVDLSWSKYRRVEPQLQFADRLLAELRQSPGILHTALASSVPLNAQQPIRSRVFLPGSDTTAPAPPVDVRIVTPDYFETMGVAILKGRAFSARDRVDAPPVAAVNQALADAIWRGVNPVGEMVRIQFASEEPFEVIGVVPNVRHEGLASADVPAVYLPYRSSGGRDLRVLVRTTLDRVNAEARLRDVVHELDPEQPVTEVRTLREVRREAMTSPRVTTFLVGGFALLALIITATGIAGVIAYSVTQRTREIGIRIALGADRRQVLGIVMRQGLVMVGIGLLTGAVGALALTRVMGSAMAGAGLLFGIRPTDLGTFLGVGLVLLAVAVAACFTPARRATTVDPITALRCD